MPTIEIGPDLIHIDAEIVAKALKLTPQDLQARMQPADPSMVKVTTRAA